MKTMNIILLGASAAFLALTAACTDPSKANRVLTEQGYTDIEMDGYGFMDCSEDDAYATGFIATSQSGHRVKGTVCSGLFKGNTVRID